MGNAGWANGGVVSLPFTTIIGIVFGCVIGAAVVVLIVYCCCCQKREYMDSDTRASSDATSTGSMQRADKRRGHCPNNEHQLTYLQGRMDEEPQHSPTGSRAGVEETTVFVAERDSTDDWYTLGCVTSARTNRGQRATAEGSRTVSVAVPGPGLASNA